MAQFASLAAAELRAIAKGPAGDRTWLYAHSAYVQGTSTPCVRVIRYMTGSASPQNGAWVEITDDATV
jgi:hypothetical protein